MPSRLTPTLARRAERAAKLKLGRVLENARADVALIKRRKNEATEAFYDMGEALVRLNTKVVIAALGHRTFAELCAKELDISAAWASKLMTVVKRMTREQALKLGAVKSGAIVDLVDATPQADTPAGVLARGARLPGGERLDVKHASGRAIERAAKAVRAASPKRSARGRQVAAEDAAYGAKLEKSLHALGAREAKVSVVAGLPGKPARLRIEGVTVREAPLLARAITKAR